jgi:HTH-type transcriptional regulator/antitoxin HigA
MMDIRPIKTEADYEAALTEIERLMDAEANTAEGDRLEVLATLVEAYERVHCSIDDPDPIAAIEHRLEALGLSRQDLEPLLGGRSLAAKMLTRQRPLSLAMIRRLHQALQLPVEVLIRPYPVTPRSRRAKRPNLSG